MYSHSEISCLFSPIRNEALRVAFIDEVETMKDGIVQTDFYSKLVKADINGKDKVFFHSSSVFSMVFVPYSCSKFNILYVLAIQMDTWSFFFVTICSILSTRQRKVFNVI